MTNSFGTSNGSGVVTTATVTARGSRRFGRLVAGCVTLGGILGIAGSAGAAVQGQLGATSSGRIAIQVTKAPMLKVAASMDVVFERARMSATGWEHQQAVCVQGRGIAGYRVAVEGGNAAVRFDGRNGSEGPLPVKAGDRGCGEDGATTLTLSGPRTEGVSVVTLMVIPE